MGHRTVNSDCPVHHQTIRWARMTELQRSNLNGWVTWLVHRTVPGRTPDCPVCPSTANLPNDHFGGWGYKYPPTTTLQGIQVFQPLHSIQELYTSLQDTNKRSNPLKSKVHSNQIVTSEREILCSFEFLRLDHFSSSFFLVLKQLVINARDTKLWWSLRGV